MSSLSQNKWFKIIAVGSDSPPYGSVLVQTSKEKGRIVELVFEQAFPEYNLQSLIRSGGWFDNFEPFSAEKIEHIKHLIDTAKK